MAGSYEVGKLVWQITGDTSGLEQSLKKSESKFSSFVNTAKGFLGLGLVAGFLNVGKSALKGASDLEQQNVAFTTLLGSASKAKSLIGELRDLAAFTPFSQSGLIENAKLLLNFGVNANEVKDILSRLGDVASGDQNKLNSLTLAFAQASSAGKLTGQDLLQMINAGFNPLQEISAKTGKSMATLRKEMESGKIGIDQVKGAFVSATSEGGRFYQMNQKQSETLAGQWSTLLDNIEVFLTKLGSIESKPIKELVGNLNTLLTLINKGSTDFSIFAEAIELSFAPLNALVSGLTSAAEALGIGQTETEKLTAEIARLEEEEQRYIRMKIPADSADIKNLREKISLTKDLLRNSLVPTAESELDSWKKRGIISDDTLKNEIKQTKELSDADKKYISERNKLRDETKNFIFEAENSETEKIKSEFDERVALYKKYKLDTEKDISDLSDYAILTNEKIKKSEIKEYSDRLSEFNSYVQAIGGGMTNLLSSFQSLFAAIAKSEIDSIDARMQAELEAAGVSEQTSVEQAQKEYDLAVQTGDALTIEEKRKALVKAQIEEKYQKKKAQIEYEAAKTGWQFQLTMATASAGLAVMNALTSGWAAAALNPSLAGWYPALLASMAGIAGAAQIAAVAVAEPQPPKFASGGIIPGSAQGTTITAGENNQTEIVMNPNQMANTLMAIGNGATGGYRQLPPMSRDDLFSLIFEASQNGDLFIAERAITNR